MEKETKKYKTAAALRRIMEDRLAAEKLKIIKYQAHLDLIAARIEVITELLETADANGNEEDGEAHG